MKCSKCGSDLRPGAKFCPQCGTVVEAAGAAEDRERTAAPEAGTAGPQAAASVGGAAPTGGKRRGLGLIVMAAVVVVALVAVIAVAAGALFSSPQDKVEKAFDKTASAYAELDEAMGLPDLTQLAEQQSMTQRLSLELASINEQLTGMDLSALKGLGLRVDTDYDLPARKLAAEVAAYWGTDELISAWLLLEDNGLYLSVPQIADDVYGVDTTTMGADLAALTGEDMVETLGFNFFDLIDLATPAPETTQEMEQALDQAARDLLEAMEVEKAGSETIDVNGKNIKANAFDILIPQEAMEDYADALLDAAQTVDYMDLYEELLEAMGMPKELIDSAMSSMGGDPYREMFRQTSDGIGAVLDELGDLELTAYLSDGHLAALVYDDHGLEVGLYLGGGERYVDDLSLEISVDGDRILLESSGDHSGKSGVFTDETVLRFQSGGETVFRLTSEFSYDPKAEDNGLFWEISVDDLGSLSIEGQMTTTKNSLELVLEDISVKAMGMELVALEAEYYVGPCEGIELSADGAVMLLEMSESELYDLGMELEANAEDWVYDLQELLYDRLPEELLWALMYGYY